MQCNEVLYQTRQEMSLVAECSLGRLVIDWIRRQMTNEDVSVSKDRKLTGKERTFGTGMLWHVCMYAALLTGFLAARTLAHALLGTG